MYTVILKKVLEKDNTSYLWRTKDCIPLQTSVIFTKQ